MLIDRRLMPVLFGGIVCLCMLAASPPTEKAKLKSALKLPAPPARLADATVQAKKCIECHDDVADSLKGDKHIAADFHCVVCHGQSKAHLECEEEEGSPPDRAWRHWVDEENSFKWRMKNASIEIARFCASCHGRKPPEGKKRKTIDWKAYLETGHGKAISKGSRDAPTCTDCHYAHGAGSEPLTDKTIVRRCSLCHNDRQMMKRVDIDPDVVKDFKAGTHATMDSVSAEEKSSCVKCHYPH